MDGRNLKTTKYRDGTSLLNVSDSTTWTNMTTDAYCWYKNDSVANSNKYGALYNWYAASNEKLCPTGWHVPTDLEWTVLEEFLGGSSIAGGRMKTVNGWNSPNTGATNSSGFSGISSGNRREDGLFPTVGYIAIWWTSTEFHRLRPNLNIFTTTTRF